MTDTTPEEIAFRADMDRLRAQAGAARLEEASRRGIGDQMLTDALLRIMDANEMDERARRFNLWSRPAEPGWGWSDTPSGD
jgi:hypothetical protein